MELDSQRKRSGRHGRADVGRRRGSAGAASGNTACLTPRVDRLAAAGPVQAPYPNTSAALNSSS